jgi:hypothetical protein
MTKMLITIALLQAAAGNSARNRGGPDVRR